MSEKVLLMKMEKVLQGLEFAMLINILKLNNIKLRASSARFDPTPVHKNQGDFKDSGNVLKSNRFYEI